MRIVIAQLIITLLWIPVAANAQTLTLEQRFKQLDRNGDQRLSRQELRQTPNILRADRNRDGFVSLDEARTLIGNRNRRTPPEPTQEHASGKSSAMFELMQRSEMPSGALAVGVLDVDSDGFPDLLLSSTHDSVSRGEETELLAGEAHHIPSASGSLMPAHLRCSTGRASE